MMEIEDVAESLCVEVTTASSLVHTTMRRMTAVRSQQQYLYPHLYQDNNNKVGAPGPSGAPALPPVDLGILTGPGNVWAVGVDRQAFILRIGRRKYVLHLTVMILNAKVPKVNKQYSYHYQISEG